MSSAPKRHLSSFIAAGPERRPFVDPFYDGVHGFDDHPTIEAGKNALKRQRVRLYVA
jgi:hypothetical protein